MTTRLLPTILVAVLAVLVGVLTTFLPIILDTLMALDNDSPGLERLRIGHAMAGGGASGTEFLAVATRQTLLAKIFGYVKTTKSRTAWKRLTQTLRDAEHTYLSPQWGFGVGPNQQFASDEIAEGLLYVSHVTKLALEVYLEEAPRMVRMLSPTIKLLGDNPNAQYYMASLLDHQAGDDKGNNDQKKEFIVKGCQTTNEVYLSFSVHAPNKAGDGMSNGAFERVVTDINDLGIVFDTNGCYQLYMSPTHPGEAFLQSLASDGASASWLETPPEATTLVSRHYFVSNPGQPPGAIAETVTLSIERYGNKKRSAPLPVSDATMAMNIDRANDFLERHTLRLPQPDPTTAPPFFSLKPNTIGIPQKWKHENEGMGAVDILYAAGRFLLQPNEALVLEGNVPSCRFANVVVWNRFLQTLDYTQQSQYPVSAVLSKAAPFRIVLSQEKPKGYQGTWIYTEGRPTGTVFFRYLLPDGNQDGAYPKINAKVVKIDDIASE